MDEFWAKKTSIWEDSPNQMFLPHECKDFAVLQSSGWLIKGIIPRAELVVVYGPPGCGKSFAALDMGMAIARDLKTWGDYKVKAGKVVYVCAEAPAGFKNRILAYAQHNSIIPEEITNFFVIDEPPNLLNISEAGLLSSQIGKSDLIIIDTLSSVITGGDENAAKDMTILIANCKSISKSTGATVVLIHHCGKDTERGSRGWSGLLGAVDAEIKVEKTENDHFWSVTKQKEGEIGKKQAFNLFPVVLGTDEDGDDITSCFYEHSEIQPRQENKKSSLGGVQKIIMDCFDKMPEKPVMLDDLAAMTVSNMVFDSSKKDERRKRFFNSLETLQTKGILSVYQNFVYKI